MEEKKISRRGLILGGIGGAIGVAGAVAFAQISSEREAPVSGNKLAAADRSLRVLQSSDQGFATEMDAHFPGLLGDAAFSKLAPLACLVKHEQGPAIRAYSVSWDVSTGDDSYSTNSFHYAHPNSKRRTKRDNGKAKAKTRVSGQTDILAQNQVRLVTPFFALSPASFSRSPHRWRTKVAPREPASFLLSEAANAAAVKVQLDAVVFSDRKVLGTDPNKLRLRLKMIRNAEHDLAGSTLKLYKSGAGLDGVRKALSDTATDYRVYADGRRLWYVQAKQRYAQFLLDRMADMKPDQFVVSIRRTRDMKRTKLRKIASS